MEICDCCRRLCPGSIQWQEPTQRESIVKLSACSMQCLSLIKDRSGQMVDVDTMEQKAVTQGGREGGQYLESIGKTDLATLTEDEWNSFLLCVVGGYHDAIVKAQYEGQK